MKVKLNKRAILVLIGIIAVILIIVLVVRGGKEEDPNDTGADIRVEGNTKIITGDKLSETKNFNGLEFSNVKFEINDVTTEIAAEVKNTTSKSTDEQYIDFNVYDKKGNKVVTIGGYVVSLAPGETTIVSTTRLTEENDTKAYNVEIVPQQTASEMNNDQGENPNGEQSEDNNNQGDNGQNNEGNNNQ